MKSFLAFVKKEFYHIIRDKRTLLILFGMPVAQVLLFGFALTNDISEAKFAVLDESKDAGTLQLQEKMDASSYFHLVKELKNEKEIPGIFQRNEARLVIIFPQDFSEKLQEGKDPAIRLVSDASDPNLAEELISYASSIIQDYVQKQRVNIQTTPMVVPQMRMLFNPELKSVYMFVPGVMGLILLLVSAMMTSLTIAREKEFGTMELLLVSPLKPIHIIVGKVAPYWLLAFINSMIIILLGVFVFHMPLNGSVILLVLSCLLFSFTALSLGIFISARANSQMTAMFASMLGLLLPTLLLSGFIFPIENMPWLLRMISYIIPARWFIVIIKGLMIKGTGIALLWKSFLILIIMTIILMIAGIKSVKSRLG
jgi:drug efflux transport system permease protein